MKFANKLLISGAFVLIGATAIAAAPSGIANGDRTTIVGRHARVTMVAQSDKSFIRTELADAGLVTIFSNLASKYPKGEYWCCEGYNIMGPNSGLGEQWMAAAFTPGANHTVTKIEVAVGYTQGTNGVVISLNKDSNGMPGSALKTWNASALQNFGTCCAIVVKSDRSGIPVSAGKQYWIVLSTNGNETDTVDAWNFNDTDQVDTTTLASYTNDQWTVFQASGVGFAVKGID